MVGAHVGGARAKGLFLLTQIICDICIGMEWDALYFRAALFLNSAGHRCDFKLHSLDTGTPAVELFTSNTFLVENHLLQHLSRILKYYFLNISIVCCLILPPEDMWGSNAVLYFLF